MQDEHLIDTVPHGPRWLAIFLSNVSFEHTYHGIESY